MLSAGAPSGFLGKARSATAEESSRPATATARARRSVSFAPRETRHRQFPPRRASAQHGRVALGRAFGGGARRPARRRVRRARGSGAGAEPAPDGFAGVRSLRLRLAAHYATVATFVPTDVDAHIRHHHWMAIDDADVFAAAHAASRKPPSATRRSCQRASPKVSPATTASGSRCARALSDARSRSAWPTRRRLSQRGSTPSSIARSRRSPAPSRTAPRRTSSPRNRARAQPRRSLARGRRVAKGARGP